jgi:hypothetical protein
MRHTAMQSRELPGLEHAGEFPRRAVIVSVTWPRGSTGQVAAVVPGSMPQRPWEARPDVDPAFGATRGRPAWPWCRKRTSYCSSAVRLTVARWCGGCSLPRWVTTAQRDDAAWVVDAGSVGPFGRPADVSDLARASAACGEGW